MISEEIFEFLKIFLVISGVTTLLLIFVNIAYEKTGE